MPLGLPGWTELERQEINGRDTLIVAEMEPGPPLPYCPKCGKGDNKMVTSPSHSYPLGRLLALVRGENPPSYSTEGMYYEACEACITHDVAAARRLLLVAAEDIQPDDPDRAEWIRQRSKGDNEMYEHPSATAYGEGSYTVEAEPVEPGRKFGLLTVAER